MFDTKLRRQSIARDDLFHGHIGGMDTMARSLLAAASIIERARSHVATSATPAGTIVEDILDGDVTLQQLHDAQITGDRADRVSGRQEALENLVPRHIERAR